MYLKIIVWEEWVWKKNAWKRRDKKSHEFSWFENFWICYFCYCLFYQLLFPLVWIDNQVFYFRWFALIIGCFSFVYLFALRIDDRVLCCINLSSLEKICLSMIFEEEWIGKTNFLDSEAYERIWRHTASTFLYVVYCFHYGLLCVLSFVINSNSSSRILLKNQVSTYH